MGSFLHQPASRRSQLAGMALLGLGVAFYLLFTIGEVAGGDITGLQHLPPAVLLGSLLVVAARRPRLAGLVLLGLAVALGALFLALVIARDLPPAGTLIVVLPPAVAGGLLVRAGRSTARRSRFRRGAR